MPTRAGVLSSVLSTIEQRYRFSNSRVAFIPASQDITTVVIVSAISYYGGRGNKQRWLGVALLCMGGGALLTGLIQFMGQPYKPASAGQSDPLCLQRTPPPDCGTGGAHDQTAYALFIIGQVLISIGGTTLYCLVPTSLADAVPSDQLPLYVGGIFASAAIGPAVGFLMAGSFLDWWVDPGTPDSFGLDPTDRSWVGNWWLGFFICGGLAILLALPLFVYNRFLPHTKFVRDAVKKQDEGTAKADQIEHDAHLSWDAIKVVLTNMPFALSVLASTFDAFAVAAFSNFLPTIVQFTFEISASDASIYVGMCLIPGAAGGIIVFAYLVERWNLNPKETALLIFWVSVGCTLLMPILFLHCPAAPMVGVNHVSFPQPSPQLPFLNTCNQPCNCSFSEYTPICGVNGNTYASPCLAGCFGFNSTTYVDCKCIGTSMTTSTAVKGYCLGKDCTTLPAYLVGVFLICFLLFGNTGIFTTMIMSALPYDYRSLGLGMQNILYRIGGAIPGPIVFGILVDGVCSAWQVHCGKNATCIYYNNLNLAVVTAIVGIACKVAATVAYWCAYKSFVTIERRPAVTEVPGDSEVLSQAISEYAGVANRASVVSVPDESVAVINGTSDMDYGSTRAASQSNDEASVGDKVPDISRNPYCAGPAHAAEMDGPHSAAVDS
jgi:sodium-independent organic anion transporter